MVGKSGDMKTECLTMQELKRAGDLIRQGECVAFQTETVYGLGADATNSKAVKKIYQAKGRPSDNPLIIHVASQDQAREYVEHIPQHAQKLMNQFWPGPLTLILPARKDRLSKAVTAGLDTVGVRFPATEAAQALIRESKRPIAAPSANLSGRPSPTKASHVLNDLEGRIAAVLDSGPAEVGVESTIVDVSSEGVARLLRPGGITKEDIEQVIGSLDQAGDPVDEEQTPMAPGMKYTHYSPHQSVYIVNGTVEHWLEVIRRIDDQGELAGVMANDQLLTEIRPQVKWTYSLGQRGDIVEASARLFDGLRYMDASSATIILVEGYDRSGLGLAYMNRLEKAAGNRYL